MAKKRVAVLFGGRSAEHEISVISALQAIEALDTTLWEVIPVYITQEGAWYTGEALLDKNFYRHLPGNLRQLEALWAIADPSLGGFVFRTKPEDILKVDVCLLAFHGQEGEDGSVQGLLQLAQLPYTSCGVTASAMAMDKYASKMFLKAHGIPVLPCVTLSKQTARSDFANIHHIIANDFGGDPYPLFIKPRTLGSSIGVASAKNKEELERALAKALNYDNEVIVEPFVEKRMEINVSVRYGTPPIASVVEIPLGTNLEALSYEDKYLRGKSKFATSAGMASLSRVIDPENLEPAVKEHVRQLASDAYAYLGCRGVVRFDFLYDLANNILYFNELNPIPGSLSFYLWQKSEPSLLYSDLLDLLLQEAIAHHGEGLTQERKLPFQALLQ